MRTKENRPNYNRDHLRYPSDLTYEEWAIVEPLIPAAKRGGNKRSVDIRDIVNGVLYVLRTGCQWRAIPKNIGAKSTIFEYFQRWQDDRTLDRLHDALYARCRELVGRETSPTAAIIDSQSGKSAEKGGPRLTRRAMTRVRKSRVRNGISS